jgi:4-aminobutyrate aminotransferase
MATSRDIDPTPPPAEGDQNLSAGHQAFVERCQDGATRAMLADDSRYFLHQSLSSPCLSAVRRADGIWLEDHAGRRYMDFHGNNVHHVGYGHPRLIAALKAQLDELPFAPRRFTCAPAVALAAKLTGMAPAGLDKLLLAPSGSDAIDMALKLARAVTGRHKTVSFWDSFHGAGFGGSSIGGEALFR